MLFYKHKATGNVFPEKDLVVNSPEVINNYEPFYDPNLDYLLRISNRLGWIIFFLAVQFAAGVIAFII